MDSPALRRLAVLGAALSLGCGVPIFFVEVEEPRVCQTYAACPLPFDPNNPCFPPPFLGTPPGTELRLTLPFPLPSGLVLKPEEMVPDSAPIRGEDIKLHLRLSEVTLIAREGIADFNSFESASVSIKPPPGSDLPAQTLVSYQRDPNLLPGETMRSVGQDKSFNLLPYITSTVEGAEGAETVEGIEGLDASDGFLAIELAMTGSLPEDVWTADVKVCLEMRARVNYAGKYGL